MRLETLLRRFWQSASHQGKQPYIKKADLRGIGFHAARVGREQYMVRQQGSVLEVYRKSGRGYEFFAEYLRKEN